MRTITTNNDGHFKIIEKSYICPDFGHDGVFGIPDHGISAVSTGSTSAWGKYLMVIPCTCSGSPRSTF